MLSQLPRGCPERLRRRLVHRARLAPAAAAVPTHLQLRPGRAEPGRRLEPRPVARRRRPLGRQRWGAGRRPRRRRPTRRPARGRCGCGSPGRRTSRPGCASASRRTGLAGELPQPHRRPDRLGRPAAGHRRPGRVGRGAVHPVPPPRRRQPPGRVVSVLYRLRTDVAVPASTAQGSLGIVDVPVEPGRWQTVAFDLLADLVGAVAGPGRPGQLPVRHRVPGQQQRSRAGRRLLRLPAAWTSRPATTPRGGARPGGRVRTSPDVLGLIGTEISLGPHLNQFGGDQSPYDYGAVGGLDDGARATSSRRSSTSSTRRAAWRRSTTRSPAAAGGLDPGQVIATGC